MSLNPEPAPGRTGRSPRRRAPLYRRAAFYLPLIFLLSFGGAFGALWYLSPVDNVLTGKTENRGTQFRRTLDNLFNPRKPLQKYFMDRPHVSVLLLGLDHVPTRKKDPNPPRRCDSILLADVGLDNYQLRLLSIPRDSWVEQEVLGRSGQLVTTHDKLGHSFAHGMSENATDPHAGGINRTKTTIENLTGVPIDYYVVIQFEGLVKLIDALHGLDVDVEKRMKYNDNAGNLHIDLQQGPQHLNGEQVVGYARFRHDWESDMGRMRRQQQVIRLVIEKLRQPEYMSEYPRLAKLMLESVRTNMTVDQLYALARDAKYFQDGGIQSQTLMSYWNHEPGHRIDLPGADGGVDAQYVDPADVEKAMVWWNDLTPPPPPTPENPCGSADTSTVADGNPAALDDASPGAKPAG